MASSTVSGVLVSRSVQERRSVAIAGRFGIGLLLLVGLAVTAGPFLAALWSTLKPQSDVLQGHYLTLQWSLENYTQAWTIGGMSRYLGTTLVYATVGTVLTVLSSALAGYAFGRLRFPARDLLFTLILATMMIPGSVTLIPLVVVMLRIPLAGGNNVLGFGGTGLYNTMVGLVLPSLSSPAFIFLLRQFFRMLPSELEDAARIDGAGEFQIWWQIMLPLSGPGLATVALFTFQSLWNSYLWPLVMSTSQGLYTVSVGLAGLQQTTADLRQVTVHPMVLAGGIMLVVPIFLVFLVGQRYFRQGVALTGFK